MRSLILLLLFAIPAVAQDDPKLRKPRTEGLFMCPCDRCKGKWLPNCGNRNCAGAEELRAHLLRLEDAGHDDTEIKGRMAEVYGTEVIAAPDKRGLAATTYILPLLILLFGGYLLFTWARRRIREAEAAAGTDGPKKSKPVKPVTPEEEARVAEALGELE